jgi:hypothetical protein
MQLVLFIFTNEGNDFIPAFFVDYGIICHYQDPWILIIYKKAGIQGCKFKRVWKSAAVYYLKCKCKCKCGRRRQAKEGTGLLIFFQILFLFFEFYLIFRSGCKSRKRLLVNFKENYCIGS